MLVQRNRTKKYKRIFKMDLKRRWRQKIHRLGCILEYPYETKTKQKT